MSWSRTFSPCLFALATLALPSAASAQGGAETSNGDAETSTSGEIGADSSGISTEGSASLESNGVNLRLGIGFALPSLANDLDDRYTGGGTVGLDAGLRLGDFIIGGAASYAGLPFDQAYFTQRADEPLPAGTNARGEDGTLRVYQLEAQGRWIVYRGELQPYLLLGGGLVMTDPDRLDIEITPTDQGIPQPTESSSENLKAETSPVLSFGVGAQDRQESFEFYAQVRADIIFAEEISPLVMITVGVGL